MREFSFRGCLSNTEINVHAIKAQMPPHKTRFTFFFITYLLLLAWIYLFFIQLVQINSLEKLCSVEFHLPHVQVSSHAFGL